MTHFLRFFVIAGLAAAPAAAREDAQIWTGFTASGPVAGELALHLEGQLRFGDDVSRLNQSVLRGGIGWQVRDGVTLYAGYVRQTTHQDGPDTREDRLWQQASYPFGEIGRIGLTGRTRLEQRHVQGASDWAWRLRQQVKGSMPLRRESDVKLVGSVELLLHLNDADWGARSGVDQVRSFAGVNLPLADRLTLETGYLNRFQRRAGEDQMDHILQLGFAYRFGE